MSKLILFISLFSLFGFVKQKGECLLIWNNTLHVKTEFAPNVLAFKVIGEELQMDTAYNIKSKHFASHCKENLHAFPALSAFLSKSLPEYRYLAASVDEKACETLASIDIQCTNGSKVDLIHFKRINDCYSTHDSNLSGIYDDLITLKKKYTR